MENLIITSGYRENFTQIRTFVESLRSNGSYGGYIAICDNAVGGTWNNPGGYSTEPSFTSEQSAFFAANNVDVYTLYDLIVSNNVPEETIKNIKSPTQRYPYKFIYNTLISKAYLGKVENICYFDSDIYFQAPVKPIFEDLVAGKINIVHEWLLMKDSKFLSKWLQHSDYSQVSHQEDYDNTMMNAEDYCSGFFASDAVTFHRFNQLALLLTSNQLVKFYSDQPLVNILLTYYGFPYNALSWKHCLHLGELSAERYQLDNKKIVYESVVPIAVHFNGGKYATLIDYLLTGKMKTNSFFNRVANKIKNI